MSELGKGVGRGGRSAGSDTVLVTGGAGYIGSHVCKALRAAGFAPVSFDDLSRGHEWAVKWGPLVRGNLLDRQTLLKTMNQHRPVAIVHLAGFTYVGESVRDPLLYYQNNISGSLCLLECAVDQGIGALVFSSSAAVYGDPLSIPIGEDHPLAPINPYGFTKVAVERFLRDAEAAGDLRSISLRYFNAAGADPDGEAGEAHDPETHLIPLVLTAARTGTPARDLRHRLRHARRHLHPGLHSRLGSGRRARAVPPGPARRRPQHGPQSGDRRGPVGAPDPDHGRSRHGSGNPRSIWAPAPGRPTPARGRPGQGPARTRVDTPLLGHRNNYPYSLELDEPGMKFAARDYRSRIS